MFDLLLKGGEVVDPGGEYGGRLDVAVKRNRIAAVDREIPESAAFQVINAEGQYVTPGLVDLHTHVYHSVTYWGVRADPIAARSGVTTWIDVGSAGAFNLQGFREFIVKPAEVMIYALLNIASIGLTGSTGEHINLDFCDVDLCCKLIDCHRDLVLGIKVRIDKNTVGPHGLEPLRRARQAADRCELPLMTHIAVGPPLIEEVLDLMRPGDILTHCFTGQTMRIIDEQGKLREAARRAWEMGLIMDIGHGAGSFSFETAEALIAAGYRPDVISSDIHQVSIHGPLFDMPTCMSKFLLLGMSFPEIIKATTVRPAEVLGLQHDVGTLRPGARANLALFKILPGRFPFYDIHMQMREGRELIRNTLTIVNGRPLQPAPLDPPAPWIELLDAQRELVKAGHLPDLMAAHSASLIP